MIIVWYQREVRLSVLFSFSMPLNFFFLFLMISVLFLLKSYEAICDKNFFESLYYETLSMGLWLRRSRFSFDDYLHMATSETITTT